MRRILPYGLTGLGLGGGLLVILFGPLPSRTLNVLIGGVLLAIAVLSVTYLIVGGNDLDGRGPDF